MSDVDFDPENGSRMVQLARGAIFAQIRALSEIESMLRSTPIYRSEVSFSNHLCFLSFSDLSSERDMVVNVRLHQFERSRRHSRPADYGPPVSHRVPTFVLLVSRIARSFIACFRTF